MIATLLIAAAAPALAPALAPLAPLVGHCWAAELPGGQRDLHCFEAMYDGRFVRDRHEVSGGGVDYRGETVYGVEAGQVAYTYWSSDGATLRGTMHSAGSRLDFGEIVVPGAGRAETRLRTEWVLADGSYDARWTSPDPRLNRAMHYVRADGAAPAAR